MTKKSVIQIWFQMGISFTNLLGVTDLKILSTILKYYFQKNIVTL